MRELLWQRAASFAARAHRGQVRKDGVTPYYAHPVRVAMIVREVFGCEDQTALAAAFLHDTIEDTTTDYDDLLGSFGPRIADCVAALTKNMALPEAAREKDYDARLAHADWIARLVKLADQYDNYTDRASLTPAGRKRALAKCKRALALAARDVRGHEETRRAVAALRGLLRKKAG